MRTFALVCACAVACGGSSSTAVSNAVTGTIDSRSFSARDAVTTTATGSGFVFGGPATYIEITDYAAACTLETAGQQPANGQRLLLAIAAYDASGHPAAPTSTGTFTVQQGSAGGPNAKVAELYYDGGCHKAQAHAGLSGTVTLINVGPDGSREGTFDITITCDGFSSCTGPDAHLTGSFHATSCAGLNVNATPACS